MAEKLKGIKKGLIISSVMILLPMVVGLILWGRLPEQIPTHWNVSGQVDSYNSRAFVVFGMPLILLTMQWLCIIICLADPKNGGQSSKVIAMVLWICPITIIFAETLMFSGAMGMVLPVGNLAIALVGLLFIIIGNYLPKCKQNYTIGIKTPWTMNDEANWLATHRLGSKLWVGCGVLLLLSVLVMKSQIMLAVTAMVLIAGSCIAMVLYSHAYYVKNK